MRLKQVLLFASMSLCLLVGMGQSQGPSETQRPSRPLGSHDEPIVIDNGPIVVARRIANDEDGPYKEGGQNSWHIHDIKPLGLLHARVKKRDGTYKMHSITLAGIKRIQLNLVSLNGADGEPIWLTKRGGTGTSNPMRLHSMGRFLLEDVADGMKTNYKFRPVGVDNYRIKEVVTYDNASGTEASKKAHICLRDEMAPHSDACGTDVAPDEIRVVVCIRDLTVMCPAWSE